MLKKILLMLAVLAAFTGCSKQAEELGAVRVRVLDGMTDTPISSACVTVPETCESFLTGEGGLTAKMELPVIRDPQYDLLLENPEGRITLIVRAEGYTPYLLLYARITPGCERTIEILLFPDDGTLPVFTVIEAPPAAWSEELLKKYG